MEEVKEPEEKATEPAPEAKKKRAAKEGGAPRKPKAAKASKKEAKAAELSKDNGAPAVEAEGSAKRGAYRDATMEEREILNAKGLCWKVRDYGNVAKPCPSPRLEGEAYCEHHMGVKAPKAAPAVEAKQKEEEVANDNGKVKKAKAKKKAAKKAAPTRKNLRAVTLVKGFEWKSTTAPQRRAILGVIARKGEASSQDIIQALAGHEAFKGAEKEGKLQSAVRATIQTMKRLKFVKYA